MIYVINLDRSTDRLDMFCRRNAHVQFERFPAIDGGEIPKGLPYTPGAMGCALSHLELWKRCADGDEPFTICEDDAVLRRDFLKAAAPLLDLDFDIIQWGWSFENAIEYELAPSLRCLQMCDFGTMRAKLDDFQNLTEQPRPFRLLKSQGAFCYTVSPAGAKKLRELALPLRPMAVKVTYNRAPYQNLGIDVVMMAAYEDMKSFISYPPLAVAPQLHPSTTAPTV